MLAEFYSQLKEENGDDIEIIFVSSDKDQRGFEQYYGEMPWVSVPFNERAIAQALGQRFRVQGIPTFVVLDAATGNIKDADGRSTVQQARGNTARALSKW